MPIRVLIVDDSALARAMLERALSRAGDIEVIGNASDPFEARRLIVELQPDVVTLDLELPRMDGITFLRKVMYHHPLPVVVVSSLTKAGSARAVEAMEGGALAVVAKPHQGYGPTAMALELVETVRQAAAVDARRFAISRRLGLRPVATAGAGPARPVLIGASLGGPAAVSAILTAMPSNGPPLLVALHMPAPHTQSFAERLDGLSRMHVAQACQGDTLRPGLCLVAPGDRHTLLGGDGNRPCVVLRSGPPLRGHRPSIDALFESASRVAARSVVGVILTGMGSDGAAGLRAMHDAGATTIAQDRESAVVFGMPGSAIELGAVDHVTPLDQMAVTILRMSTVATVNRVST